MSYFKDVKKFQEEVLKVKHPKRAEFLTNEHMTQRINFIGEELNELVGAALEYDMTKIADALADIVYVTLGTAALMGLPFEDIWKAVQKANMSKLPGVTKRGMAIDAIKPNGWVGPELEIENAINNGGNNGML